MQLLPALGEGGVERGTVDINREFVRLGHISIVISSGGRLAPQIEADGGQHIAFDVASKNILTAPYRIWKLHKLLKELRPDIIHARSRVPAWLVYLANKSLNIPFVTTVHGFNSVNFYSSIMTKGDKIICVSTAIKEYIQKNYQTDEGKIVIIPRGIDLEEFDPTKIDDTFIQTFKSKFALQNSFIVTSVGRITQLKDYETFIKAIKLAKNQIPNIKGLIVGGVHPDKVDYFERLKKLVTELEMEDSIIFAGSQSNMRDIYALSNIVISASKKPESFGRSAAEALAMNCPVIATNHGGITDIVINGKTGYLVSTSDESKMSEAIVKVSQKEFRNLREFVENNFTLKNMTNSTLNLYSKITKL